MTKRKNAMTSDVVDDIEQIALREIAELRKLIDKPDARLTEDTIGRLQKLLDLVVAARKEQRDQLRWINKLDDDDLSKIGGA